TAIEAVDLGQCRKDIFEHREGKRLAQMRGQDRGKPLFCGRCVLDWDHCPDPPGARHLRIRSAAVMTMRASASRSARVCIRVRLNTTGTSSPAAPAASSSSAMYTSRMSP